MIEILLLGALGGALYKLAVKIIGAFYNWRKTKKSAAINS